MKRLALLVLLAACGSSDEVVRLVDSGPHHDAVADYCLSRT